LSSLLGGSELEERHRTMSFKRRLYLVIFMILAVAGELFWLGYVAAGTVEAADVVAREVLVPASLPNLERLNLLSVQPVTVEGQRVGRVFVYDDATTKRSADYLELYNNTDNLVAVGWFDRFGIERVALDRGLLREAHKLEGVFVVLLEGDSL
jgi:hypothetical protein